MQWVETDKNEAKRKEDPKLPVRARSRMVTPGFKALDALVGNLRKDAPTLPLEALLFLLQTSSSKGWPNWAKDVGSAFLSGGYFSRSVCYRAERWTPGD